MSELRPRNRRDFVRLRVYGVPCEFTPNAAAEPAAEARSAAAAPPQVPAPARTDNPGRGGRGGVTGGLYADMIAQLYRSDRMVHVERRPAAPPRPSAPLQPVQTPRPANAASGTPEAGQLLDVGGGGARFAVRDGDWPVRSRPSGRLIFEISGQRFEFACELVRKTENRSTFEYVAAWHRPRPAEIDRLMRAIYQVELSRRQASNPAPSRLPAPRREPAFDRKAGMWATAGLVAGGVAFLLAGRHATPLWAALTAAVFVVGLLARG